MRKNETDSLTNVQFMCAGDDNALCEQHDDSVTDLCAPRKYEVPFKSVPKKTS
jgi:hypothetical protein